MVDFDDFIIREGRADKPIGYPPNPIIRQALEKTYVSITGVIDVGDFETFLKEVADLTYDEAKNKLIIQYGTQKDLSEARLKARSTEAEAKIEQAQREALSEQRTLEDEFAEAEKVAKQYLAENLELTRRNQVLESEIKRLREELERAKATITAIPPPVPAVPLPAAPRAHGSMFEEFRRQIAKVVTIKDITGIADEVYAISLRGETAKLTPEDVEELKELLRTTAEERARKLAEIRIKPAPEIRRPRPEAAPEVPERVPRGRRRREEEAAAPSAGAPAQVAYRYSEPELQTFVSMGEPFTRDYELERVIKYNRLLPFPERWYTLSPFGKRETSGWDMGSAFREIVEHKKVYSWRNLEKDYGIPGEYIRAWKEVPKSE